MRNLVLDMKRYPSKKCMPKWAKYYRKSQEKGLFNIIYRVLFRIEMKKYCIEISRNSKIGGGCYFGHPYGITINPSAVIGKNCNIHKGVTIGQENRGIRKGTPIIGDEVWIGVNSTIVGKINIGNDVLIAPNTYVNCDVPSHSIVFGNPCVIKHSENATEHYINRKVTD
ncbi:serine acetyltransferase [Clostridium perfringens]